MFYLPVIFSLASWLFDNFSYLNFSLQAFIDKFRYNAKRASLVQSRIKVLFIRFFYLIMILESSTFLSLPASLLDSYLFKFWMPVKDFTNFSSILSTQTSCSFFWMYAVAIKYIITCSWYVLILFKSWCWTHWLTRIILPSPLEFLVAAWFICRLSPEKLACEIFQIISCLCSCIYMKKNLDVSDL